jgi:hypothetical protein
MGQLETTTVSYHEKEGKFFAVFTIDGQDHYFNVGISLEQLESATAYLRNKRNTSGVAR